MILLLLLQAETDRLANEIHRKKEKEMQELHEEKAKMVTSLISMHESDCIKTEFFSLTFVSVSLRSACFCNYFGSYPLPQTAVGR